MIIVVGGVLAAMVSWWCAPRLLTLGRWHVRRPRLALALWHIALAVGLAAAAASLIASVTLAVTSSAHGHEPTGLVQTLAGWSALLVVGILWAVVASGADGIISASKLTYGAVLQLPHSRVPLGTRCDLVTCDSDEAFACAMPGRSRAIVITTRLREILTPAQLAAVVAHERAHLSGNHYVALRLAEVHRACLPRSSRAGRQLLRSTRLLVELIADDSAARTAGAVHLANALSIVAQETGDDAMAIRAERLTGRAWKPARKLASAALPVWA